MHKTLREIIVVKRSRIIYGDAGNLAFGWQETMKEILAEARFVDALVCVGYHWCLFH